MIILGVDGSPFGPGKTAAAITEILAGAGRVGAQTDLIRHDDPQAVARITQADAVVFGSPTYRASHTAVLRALLEKIERKSGDEPLAGTPVAVVMTGASGSHFLGTRDLSTTLAGFFGTQVLAPDLYFQGRDFDDAGVPQGRAAQLCSLHGEALVELATAVKGSTALRALRALV